MLRKILDYLNLAKLFRKKDPNEPDSSYLRMMHGINRISIFMFLLAMVILLFRYVFK
jgi:hypothetical protein